MQKRLIFFSFCLLALSSFTFGSGQVNTTAVINWKFDTGTSGQTATFTEGTEDFFNTNWVSIGSNLTFKDKSTNWGIDFTRFQPISENKGSRTEDDVVRFNIRPATGIGFQPTRVSFDAGRWGTDGGTIDVLWEASDGSKTTVATGIKPNRNNATEDPTHVDYDLSSLSIPVSEGDCALSIYLFNLGNSKQAGLANVKITGNISGEIIEMTQYNLSTTVEPSWAGSVEVFPVGSVFNEGTEIKLTANRKFGQQFVGWKNAADNELISTDNPYTFAINSHQQIKAVFDTLTNYALTVQVDDGAADYMVDIAPAATLVNGALRYETGTQVTLTAGRNPLFTFTNWSTGETNPVKIINMDQNTEITAHYSAIDFIAGWDFIQPGGNGRPADFYGNDDNQVDALILRNADGNTQGWLDKSQMAAGGYEGRPAAVNWKNLTDKYYYQISFNAADFTGISIKSAMLFNYNAYSVQQVEYSLDGENFTKLGTVTMSNAKTWYDSQFDLPAETDHAPKVYVRWIPDYSSEIVGSTSNNDGTSLADIYVIGNKEVVNDGIPPVLVSSVPANNATGASTNGKIVLNFDEKVSIVENPVASLNGKTLPAAVSGKTITFSYSGLDYNSSYTFSLAANSVADLGGNTLASAITINFSTINRPAVNKRLFDFVVGVDGDFKAAIQDAQSKVSSGNRYYMFFPDGDYNLGESTGDANQMTTVSTPRLSMIGQSSDKVTLFNKPTEEGIGITATLYFNGNSNNNYMQDISILNKMDYRTGNLKGRAVALRDQGTKNIYKNVHLLSNQDTYYSGSGRLYFEGGSIHGTVDFICGGGDVFFNEVLLYLEERGGNVIAAPSTAQEWGYVFSHCTIDGFPINAGSYRLGRPWQNSPKAIYINTTMNILPAADGWTEMGVVPGLFAEYNSMTASGTPVDLSNRKKSFTYEGVTTPVNPYLTAEQAAEYTIENVLGGNDAWQPTLFTDQLTAPQITVDGNTISWNNNDYALCWGVFKDDKFQTFTTEATYTIPVTTKSGSSFTVRAANEMGGLSASSNQINYAGTDIEVLSANQRIISTKHFTMDGKRIEDLDNFQGVVIKHTEYENGTVQVRKIIKLK